MVDNPYKNVDVTINTINVNNYLVSLEVNEIRSGIRTASIRLDHQTINYINIVNGLIVNIDFYYGEDDSIKYNKFYGFINGNDDGLDYITIQCVDPLWKATGETLTKVYKVTDQFAGDPSKILQDMYSYIDLVADDSTIDPTDVTLPEITCDSAYIAEKTKSIVNALGWDEYYDPTDKKVHVSNSNLYIAYGDTIEVGDKAISLPEYNDNIYQTVNEIELQGVSSDSAYQQTFSGDGSQTKFILGRKPLSTYIYVEVNGVEQKGTVDGASTTYDYLINKQQGFIEFASGSIPPSGTDNIVINYTATELTSITVDDEDSQDSNSKRKLVITVKDAITVEDALTRAKSMIAISKNNFYKFNVNCIKVLDLSCRNTVEFVDNSSNKFISNLYVNSIKWKWPDFYDEVALGNKPFDIDNVFYNAEERVRALERKRQEGQVLTINKVSNAGLKVRVDDLVVTRAAFNDVYLADFYINKATQIYDDTSNGTWDNLNSINGTNSVSFGSTPGVGYATATSSSPQELLLYATDVGDQYEKFNNKFVGISFDIVGKTTGSGSTSIKSAQLIINNFPVGEIKSNSTSFTNSDSTITLGSNNDNWGTNISYYNVTRSTFGLKIKFLNNATSINIKYVGVNFYYKNDDNTIDIVKSATKLEKSDYDAGADNTVTEVTFTHTPENELEVTSTI